MYFSPEKNLLKKTNAVILFDSNNNNNQVSGILISGGKKNATRGNVYNVPTLAFSAIELYST